jgi:uncharacterized protein
MPVRQAVAAGALPHPTAIGRIKIKKYFYILRPLLAAMWAADRRTVPPMEYQHLLAQIEKDQELMAEMLQLWAEKEKAPEGYLIPLIPGIQAFIERETVRCRQIAADMEEVKVADAALVDFFRKIIEA